MSVRKLVTGVALTLLGLLGVLNFGAPPAAAVPVLTDETSPNEGDVLASSPTVLTLVFTEDLPTTPGVVLQDANLQPVVGVSQADRGDGANIWLVTLTQVLPPGTYRVRWSTSVSRGEYSFSVGQEVPGATIVPLAPDAATDPAATVALPSDPSAVAVPPTAAPATGASTPAATASPEAVKAGGLASMLAVLARFISTFGIAAIFGGLLLIAVAWPEGIEYAITARYLRAVWGAAFAATAVLLVATRADATGSSLIGSINPASWRDLRDLPGGAALLLRLVFVGASGWAVIVPERVVDQSLQIPAFAAPILSMLTFGFSRTGDGGGGALGIGASILHVVAMSAWVGGVALLARVVVAGPGDDDLLHAVRGFARLAGPALLVVVATGVVRAIELSGGGANLLETGYGRRLLVKVAFFAGLTYLGLVNRQTVRDRLGRAGRLGARTAHRLRRALTVELAVGAAVMLLGSWLVNGAAPGVSATGRIPKVDAAVGVRLEDSGVDVEIGAAPGTVGVNTLVITVRQPVTGLVDMSVTLTPVSGLAVGIEIPVAKVLSGKGVMQVEGVPLGAAGEWTVIVTTRDTDDALPTVTGTILITDPAAPVPGTASPGEGVPTSPVPGGGVPADPVPTVPGAIDPNASGAPAVVPTAAVAAIPVPPASPNATAASSP